MTTHIRRLRAWLFLLGGVMLVGCASSAKDFDSQFGADVRPDMSARADATDYTLGPADVVQVSVFGVSDLDGEYDVNFQGAIDFPLLGAVPAAGKTTTRLSQDLESKLGAQYLQNPQVRVTVLEAVSERITVDGSVVNPGIYDLQGQMSLLQAVALAGGPSEGANLKKVLIFRQIDGQRMAAAFNLKDIREGEERDPQVYGNDVIVMDGSGAKSRYENLWRAAPIIGLFRFF